MQTPNAPKHRSTPPSYRRVLLVLLRLAVILTIICFIYPVKFNLLREATLAGFVAVWLIPLVLYWRSIPVRVVDTIVAALVLIVCFAPGRPVDPTVLRTADLQALREYHGVHYVWGGESYLGIDCSGLIRRGAIDGYESVGYKTLNPRALRQAFQIYWHDCSANDLGLGYGGRTRFVENVTSINNADLNTLQPGDMAVVAGGEHILAYLGNGIWTDAEPTGAWTVEIVKVPVNRNAWFDMPGRIMRWRSTETK